MLSLWVETPELQEQLGGDANSDTAVRLLLKSFTSCRWRAHCRDNSHPISSSEKQTNSENKGLAYLCSSSCCCASGRGSYLALVTTGSYCLGGIRGVSSCRAFPKSQISRACELKSLLWKKLKVTGLVPAEMGWGLFTLASELAVWWEMGE